jgi:hypothetical protein
VGAQLLNIIQHCKLGPPGCSLIHPNRFPCIKFAPDSSVDCTKHTDYGRWPTVFA